MNAESLLHPGKAGVYLFGGIFGFGLFVVLVGAVLHRGQTKHDIGAPGLYGADGRMGGGKTYLLAVMASKAKDRVVFSNFHFRGSVDYVDFRTKHPYEWREFERGRWETVWACGCRWGPAKRGGDCGLETCVVPGGGVRVFVPPGALGGWAAVGQAPYRSLVLLDEVHTWWPSHAWRAPDWLMAWCSQLRKRRLTVVWASQEYSFIAKRLILLTFAIWRCEHYRRGHRYTLFDRMGYGSKKAVRMSRMNVVRKRSIMGSYFTDEIVEGVVEWADSSYPESADVGGLSRPAGPGGAEPVSASERLGVHGTTAEDGPRRR